MSIATLWRKIKFFVTMGSEQRKFHRIKKEFTHVGFKEDIRNNHFKLVYMGLTDKGQEQIEMLAITYVYLTEDSCDINLNLAIKLVKKWLLEVELEHAKSRNYRLSKIDFVEDYLTYKLMKITKEE